MALKYNTLNALFSAIANSLRSKTGSTGGISADDFPSVIDSISVGVEGGIIPTGTKNITDNGTYDVKSYETANVNVPKGITPTGTKSITANGSYDITNFATANVNVPASGITPTGSINITENGTFDVTDKASAVVNVPSEEQISVAIPITLSSALGGGTTVNHTLLTAHDFVKKHYAKDGFTCVWLPLTNTTTAAASGVIGAILHTNRVVFTTKSSYYGIGFRSAGATSGANAILHTTKVNGTGYTVSFRADSSGNLKLYVASSYTVPAGNYMLIMTCFE